VFLVVAAIGVATVLLLKRWVPHFAPTPSEGFRQDLKIFKRPGLWLAMAITSIGTGGFFASLSYIAPLLTDMAHFSAASIPLIMTLIGVGMTVGVHLGGKLADKVAPIKSVAILLSLMTVLLVLTALLSHSKPAILMLAFASGANALALGPSIQVLLMDHTRDAEMLGSSLGQSGFNIGNALGAFLGGIPLTLGYNYASPQWVAASLALCGVALSLLMLGKHRTFGAIVVVPGAQSKVLVH
jgi:DHA1 family arabinose polymer transporter-like MFS transporter